MPTQSNYRPSGTGAAALSAAMSASKKNVAAADANKCEGGVCKLPPVKPNK